MIFHRFESVEFLSKQSQKSSSEEGFTLIELLVVIIIIGILSAIALPNFLNLVSRSRQAEAQALLGTVNRSQQTYRFSNGIFANNLNLLEASVAGEFYSYGVDQINGSVSVTHQAVANPTFSQDVKNYASGVYYFPNQKRLSTIICEGNTVSGSATASIDINIADCDANSRRIR